MRGITLTQPWGACIVERQVIAPDDQKLLENRPQGIIARRYFGQRIAIHASSKIDGDAVTAIQKRFALRQTNLWLQTSAIIGVVTVVGAIHTEDELRDFYLMHWPFTPGAIYSDEAGARRMFELQRRWFTNVGIAYVLRDPIALRHPIPCSGWQGCRELPAHTSSLIEHMLQPEESHDADHPSLRVGLRTPCAQAREQVRHHPRSPLRRPGHDRGRRAR
jgi:hypothetical protein